MASAGKSTEMLSPPLTIASYPVGGRVLHVCRDDLTFGGTKARGIMPYFLHLKRTNPLVSKILYTGCYTGYGPVVAALGGRLAGLETALVLSRSAIGAARATPTGEVRKYAPVRKSESAGANVSYAQYWKRLVEVGKQMDKDREDVFWLPLGLEDPVFETALAEGIRNATPAEEEANPISPKFDRTVWVVGGTGVVARALARAFPRAQVCAVPASRPDRLRERLQGSRVKMVERVPPQGHGPAPYPTIEGYDSLAWDVAVQRAESGDLVWNVAGDEFTPLPDYKPEPKTARQYPLFAAELQRTERLRRLQQFIYRRLRSCGQATPGLRRNGAKAERWIPDVVARWIFALYCAGEKIGDPLLPAPEEVEGYTDSIVRHIQTKCPRLGADRAKAQEVVKRMDLPAQLASLGKQTWDLDMCLVAGGGVPRHILATLKGRWKGPPGEFFEDQAAALYHRYASLGAYGHQMAMPAPVKALLTKAFGVQTELFASAINAAYPNYYSLFPDVEAPFGSLGPFSATFRERAGDATVFVANPPYDEIMLAKMVRIFLAEAASAEDEGREFTVLFGMPAWPDFEPLGQLKKSPHVRMRTWFGDNEVPWVDHMVAPERREPRGVRIPAHHWVCVSARPLDLDAKSFEAELRKVWRARSAARV